MQIQRAFKAHIYPIDEQRVFLNKTLFCCHFLYNKMLDVGKNIPVQCGELTSVDMGALALGNNKSETAVGIPETGRSRNLGEQAE